MAALYRAALGHVLESPRRGWLLIGATVVSVAGAGVIQVMFVGGEFMPQQDEGYAQITLELPPGTPVERTSAVAVRAESLLTELPEVTSTLTRIGGGGGMFDFGAAVNVAQIQITVESDRPTTELFPAIRERMAAIPDADVTVVLSESFGGGDAPLQVLVKGPDVARLETLAADATGAIAALPGLVDVRNSIEDPRPEIAFHPRREVLRDYGLTVGQVGGLMRASIDGVVPGVYREAGEERDIRVRLAERARRRADQLATLDVRAPAGVVPLAALGSLDERAGETTIQRNDKQRAVQIDAEIGSGSLTTHARNMALALDARGFPPGYGYEITGEFEIYAESFREMGKALLIAVILTYIVLAMILESYVHPITIMVTVPLGGVGSVLALFLASARLNMFSMMALIMLVGIVVNNAILILDYAQQLRREGKGMVESLIEAGATRLRPIIMTNVAIAIALVPQAVGGGPGSFYRVPMAIVTMGGVLVSALFTLLLIPVVYVKLDRFALLGRRQEREWRRRTGEHAVA
jgi:HAE1 family hydrophobic/amphiphilic exporter-1